MMAGIVHLDVDDTSPTIRYSPSSSTSSTDLLTGWTPCFSLSGCNTKTGMIPNGTSYYITAYDDASFTLRWQGTGVQLLGNVSDTSHLNYTVYLDGNAATPDLIDLSQQILASFQNLPSQEHNVSLVVHASESNVGFLAFDKATLTSPSPINGTGNYVLQSINDSTIAWYGLWSFETVPQLGQVHRSTNVGDKVTAYFKGTALTLSGITTPYSAVYSVALAPSENDYTTNSFLLPTNFSAKTSFTNPDALLFYASSLNPTVSYSLTVTNEDGGELMIKPGHFQVFEAGFFVSPPPPSPTPHSAIVTSISDGSIAAVVLAGVLFFVVAALLVYYCLIYRPRARRCQAQFNALMARNVKGGGSPAVRSQITRESERSSYRKRINRILSMIGPSSGGQWSSQRIPPVPPIAIGRTTELFYDNNIMPDDSEEIGVVLIGAPTTTVESGYRSPEGIKGTRTVPSIFIDITQKPSPEASVPVSPNSVSIGGTQSQRHSSQISSRPHSNTFSIPISFSLRHIRARSRENGTKSTGSSGRQQGCGSSSVGHRDVGVEEALEEEDRSDDSESVIAFAKPIGPRKMISWKGNSDITEEVKRWRVREGVGKAVHSIISGLRTAGGKWMRTSTGTGVVYPFVGVASSSVPSPSRHAVSGGGLIILEGGRRIDPRLSGSSSSGAHDGKRPRGGSPHSEGTEQGTEITPLSYVNHSLCSLSARGNDLEDQRNGDSVAQLAALAPPRHPYAAVADSPPPTPSAMISATIMSPSDDGAGEPPKTLTAPAVPAIRQLPPVPTAPCTNLSQPQPGQVAKPIRALPPLPIAPISKAVAETSGLVTRTRLPPPLELELGTTPDVKEHEGSLLSPKSASDVHTESQRTSRSSKSSKGSSVAGFLTVSSVSPFRVDFLEMGSADCSEGSDSGGIGSNKRRGKQKERRPTPPKLNVALGNNLTRPTSLPPAFETAMHAPQLSFLDMGNSSSSSFSKPEPNSLAEPLPEIYTQSDPQSDRIIQVDEDRATFGQKRDRKSVYYYSSANPSLPSPADSHHTFQTHRTYQTYQSEEQSSHRPWSKGQHASWRGTFGIRPEYIPEEVTPSTPDVPDLPPEIAQALSQNMPLTTLQKNPESHAHIPSLPQEIPSDPDQGRSSYVSTSPTVATHVHPLSADFGLRQQARYRSSHPDVSTSQLDATSPTTDEVSPSSIQFGAGGIRRTSSGDVPAPSAYHAKDE